MYLPVLQDEKTLTQSNVNQMVAPIFPFSKIGFNYPLIIVPAEKKILLANL